MDLMAPNRTATRQILILTIQISNNVPNYAFHLNNDMYGTFYEANHPPGYGQIKHENASRSLNNWNIL